MVEFPLRLGRGQNDRAGHWRKRHRSVKAEKEAARFFLNGHQRPATPCVVTITRVSPGSGLDDDNLSGACKGTRDAFADWIGVDDRHRELVRYEYANARGAWGVRIEVRPA
jgi:hypothetical protein